MNVIYGVGITDEINRYNHKVPLVTIVNSYERQWDYHVIMTIGHDRTKIIGYSNLNGVYMEPGKAYLLTKSFIAENEKDQKTVIRIIDYNFQNFCNENRDKIDSLLEKLGDRVTENHSVSPSTSAIAIVDKGIVGRVFPKLIESDSDGLLDLRVLQPVYAHKSKVLIPGVYQYGDFLLFAHPYFRRSLSITNTMNSGFFDAYEKLRNNPSLKLRIAIDMDMIGLVGSESSEVEYQYWWGPHFTDSLTDIPHGVTIHTNEGDDYIFSNIVNTQFFWYEQDGKAAFECEEVCDRENETINGKPYVGCRYVHSMVDMHTQKPCHLDGAVRLYDEEQILERLDEHNDISKAGKRTIYQKIWRIDNAIDVHVWKELITQYFRDNSLIGEYFGGKDEVITQIQTKKDEETSSVADSYIPAILSKGDGIRILLKYGKVISVKEDYNAEICNSLMIRNQNGEIFKALECEIVTLIKHLQNKGIRIRMPITTQVNFGDAISNLQIINCNNVETAALVIESVFELCKAWNEKDDNKLVSFGIHVNCNKEKSATISLAGNVKDMVTVLEKLPRFSDTSIEKWIQKVYEINNRFPQANNNPNKTLLISNDSLFFRRNFVKPEYYSSSNSTERLHLDQLHMSKEDKDVINKLKINISPVYLYKSSCCNKCKKDYRYCRCIKYIDPSVFDTKQDAEKLGYIWAKYGNCLY